MAINLLPVEQKSKVKKQKASVSSRIKLTGPAKAEKKKPGVKKAGVLMFFKQAFQKPKKDMVKEEREEARKMPEKKIIFKEKIMIAKPEREAKSKVEFHEPLKKPESLKVATSPKPGEKVGGFFSGLFSKKPAAPPKAKHKPVMKPKPFVPEEQFPKYKTVRTEKILPPPVTKPRQPEVIQVTTNQVVKAKEKPKEPGRSVWQRFTGWLKGFFSKQPKVSKPASLPKPLEPSRKLPQERPLIIERKEVVVPSPEKKEPEAISPVDLDKKIGEPKEPKEKAEIFSYATPLPPDMPAKKEPEEKPVPKYEIVKPPRFVPPPPKPAKETIKKEAKHVPAPPIKELPAKKPSGFAAWLAGLWQSFKNLFKNKKTKGVPAKKEIKFAKETVKIPEQQPETKKEIPTPSFVPPVPSPLQEEEGKPIEQAEKVARGPLPVPPPPPFKKEEQATEEKSKGVPLPPMPPAKEKKGESFRLAQSEEKKFNLTQPEEIITKPPEEDWEVNLIPEESMEKEISVTKLLYLAMSLLLAGAVVFGGWLWANYYYNTITSTISEVNAEIAIKNIEISRYQQVQKEVQLLKQKITSVQELLDKHVYWSQIFNKLENYTLSDVFYKSMAADINGSVTLAAEAKDYETAVKQLFVFEEASDFVTNVTISNIVFKQAEELLDTQPVEETDSLQLSDNQVSFTIGLSVLPSIFLYPQ